MPVNNSDYALIIGINDYPHYDFPLKGAKKDAEDFAKWVNDPEFGGGVPKENTALLLSSVVDADWTRPGHEEIDSKLWALINKAIDNSETVKPRRFYFYFSGHGLGLSSEEVGLCLPFWSSDKIAAAALKLSGYRTYLQEWGLFPEIIIFLDCCRVSLQVAGGYGPMLTLAKPLPGAPEASHVTAFASTYTSAAFEAEINANGAKAEVRGFFTKSLIEALEGAAARAEGGVPLDNLLRYLDGSVSLLASQNGKKQKATYVSSFSLTDMSNIILGSAPAVILESKGASGPTQSYPFEIKKPIGTQDIEITLIGSDFELVYRGFEPFSQPLPVGKYQLRFQFSDQIKEALIRHQAPGTVYELSPMPLYSAVPFQEAASSHEYYTAHAHHWSHYMTDGASLAKGQDSSFFFFARYPKMEDAQDFDLFRKMVLLDENMKLLHDFPEGTYVKDPKGWFAFSITCKPGQYYLRFDCEPSRVIPVYCFQNWQTQVFVTMKGKEILFETLRILAARQSIGFQPNDYWATLTDLAFEYLKNPELSLPPSLAQTLVDLKFETPLLGILGAYLILQRKIDGLLDKMPIILGNLNNILQAPDCPDLLAIKALYAPEEHKKTNFFHPPMIAFGTEGIIQLDISEMVEINTNSVFERMTALRKTDMLATSWCLSQEGAQNAETWVINAIATGIINASKYKFSLDTKRLSRQLSIPVAQIEQAIIQMVEQPALLESTWAGQHHSGELDIIKTDLIDLRQNKKTTVKQSPIQIVTIFSKDTYPYLLELRENCLDILQANGLAEYWDTDKMLAGSLRQKEIHDHIEGCQIFIGLISNTYLAKGAEPLSMHNQALDLGKIFIPIIAKTGMYSFNPEISGNNPLPRQESVVKPLDQWQNRDEAWAQITEAIAAVIQNLKKRQD